MRRSRVLAVLVMAILTAGCASGVVGLTQLATILATHTDLLTDAPGNTTAGTAYDIQTVETRRIDNAPFGSYDTLRTDIIFDQAPVLPAAGAFATGNEMVLRIYFDTDQDDATGSWWNGMCGDDTGGAEYVVNATVAADVPGAGCPACPVAVARLANGNYEVVDGTAKTGEASVAITGNTLAVTVPLSALGNDNGVTHLSVRVGQATDNTTDCAPEAAGFIVTRQR